MAVINDDWVKFGGKIVRLGSELERIPNEALKDSALFTKKAVMSTLGRPNGSPLLMKGVGKKGNHKVGVTYDIKGRGETATALIRAFGQFQLIENDTKAHTIPRTRGSRRTRTASGRISATRVATSRTYSGRKILKIGGDVLTGPVTHPGTKGKHAWARGIQVAKGFTKARFESGLTRAMTKVF